MRMLLGRLLWRRSQRRVPLMDAFREGGRYRGHGMSGRGAHGGVLRKAPFNSPENAGMSSRGHYESLLVRRVQM